MSTVPIENMSLSTKARRRMRTSLEETAILESYYVKNPNPNHEQKEEIANVVKMGSKSVHFWYISIYNIYMLILTGLYQTYNRFQNRRAKDNKKRKLLQIRQQEMGKY